MFVRLFRTTCLILNWTCLSTCSVLYFKTKYMHVSSTDCDLYLQHFLWHTFEHLIHSLSFISKIASDHSIACSLMFILTSFLTLFSFLSSLFSLLSSIFFLMPSLLYLLSCLLPFFSSSPLPSSFILLLLSSSLRLSSPLLFPFLSLAWTSCCCCVASSQRWAWTAWMSISRSRP